MWILCLEELLAFAENWNLKFTCQSSAISSDSKWISLDRAPRNQVYLKLLIPGGWSRWPLKTLPKHNMITWWLLRYIHDLDTITVSIPAK